MSSRTEPKSWRIAYSIARHTPTLLGVMGGAFIAQALIHRSGTLALIGGFFFLLSLPVVVLAVEADARRKR